jgi:branched-chain amino acid transport system substrate-binding protein
VKYFSKPAITLSIAVAVATLSAVPFAAAQSQAPVKVGFMLPATGTYASLGNMIENGFKLYVNEQGGKLSGREIQYFKVDDESDPAKATDNVNKLIKRDQVDVLVGTVHSGVALAMAKVARETNTLLIVPNAGADVITGAMCAKNIFRTSFSNWQPAYAMGKVAAERGHTKAMGESQRDTRFDVDGFGREWQHQAPLRSAGAISATASRIAGYTRRAASA